MSNERYLNTLSTLSPALKKIPALLAAQGDDRYKRMCQHVLTQLDKLNQNPEKAVKAYIHMSMEYLMLQQRLQVSGRYEYSSFAEVQTKVYENPEVMNDYYLEGLLLSQIWWPNHYDLFCFYEDQFLKTLPAVGRACEIGPGHGLFTETFLSHCSDWQLKAVDISQHSIDYTRSFVSASNALFLERLDLQLQSANELLSDRNQQFDAIVCGEVLEHLEDPQKFMTSLVRLAGKDCKFFLTAAIYAASIDHIYLYHSVEDVRRQVRDAGLTIVDECIRNVNANDGPEQSDVPINYAFTAIAT